MAIRIREERGVPEWLVRAYLKELARRLGGLFGEGEEIFVA